MTEVEQPIVPNEPVKVAIIGAGQRSRTIYSPLYVSLRPWMEVVAVCDPVCANADALASKLNVPAFYDIRELARTRPMEAAIVITPVESHHSISVFLSSHGIHNMTETSWCNLLAQGRDMIAAARQNDTVVRVAENFFRFPVDRFAQELKRSDYLGRIGRIMSYNDHTGYHNNSRWIVFSGAHPLWAQSISHTMDTAAFRYTPERYVDKEEYEARFFQFPDGLMVIDHAANAKGFLGRMPRPGYTEWQGERGTLIHRATSSIIGGPAYRADGTVDQSAATKWSHDTEIRYCSDEALGDRTPFRPTGHADRLYPVHYEFEAHRWLRAFADTDAGRIVHENALRPLQPSEHFLPEYGSGIMGHLIDFALAVRGLRASEFDENDALMSLMMEVAAEESALQEGRRIALPLARETESERRRREKLREKFGVDPMDVEGMLSISYPKP